MADIVLTLNAGSSSLKFSVYKLVEDQLELDCRGDVDHRGKRLDFRVQNSKNDVIHTSRLPTDSDFHDDEILELPMRWLETAIFNKHRLAGVGHRIVHGGRTFTQPARVDAAVLSEIEKLVPLAPLHQPHNIGLLRAMVAQFPHVPQIACFDTSFHRTQPPCADHFALPRMYTSAGIIRYGFHGLSYEYVASVLPSIDAQAAAGRTIVAHLGNGASLCALQNCKSIATTMGLTPLDGLIMGTRCGSIDPGVLLHLLRAEQMSADELEDLLYHKSGLLGISGLSSDVRTLLESPDPHAAEAIDLFVYRVVREIGAMLAVLGGADALIFTAGIGEHATALRERICKALAWAGLEFDSQANALNNDLISTEASRIQVRIIPTNEELVIARHTQDLL